MGPSCFGGYKIQGLWRLDPLWMKGEEESEEGGGRGGGRRSLSSLRGGGQRWGVKVEAARRLPNCLI